MHSSATHAQYTHSSQRTPGEKQCAALRARRGERRRPGGAFRCAAASRPSRCSAAPSALPRSLPLLSAAADAPRRRWVLYARFLPAEPRRCSSLSARGGSARARPGCLNAKSKAHRAPSTFLSSSHPGRKKEFAARQQDPGESREKNALLHPTHLSLVAWCKLSRPTFVFARRHRSAIDAFILSRIRLFVPRRWLHRWGWSVGASKEVEEPALLLSFFIQLCQPA
eukprot:675794-Rhodomonas_salina.1